MKASELVVLINEAIEKYGDLEISYQDNEFGHTQIHQVRQDGLKQDPAGNSWFIFRDTENNVVQGDVLTIE